MSRFLSFPKRVLAGNSDFQSSSEVSGNLSGVDLRRNRGETSLGNPEVLAFQSIFWLQHGRQQGCIALQGGALAGEDGHTAAPRRGVELSGCVRHSCGFEQSDDDLVVHSADEFAVVLRQDAEWAVIEC